MIHKIKTKQLELRRVQRDSFSHSDSNTVKVGINVLTTLIGEVETVGRRSGKQPTDLDVQAIVVKFIKNNNETIKLTQDENTKFNLGLENALLESFLPKQLDESKLEFIIANIMEESRLVGEVCTIGRIMSVLKDNYAGQYNSAVASSIAKRLL